ncbi:ABC transporter substrate-binding protein [Clostridium cellulovorans]|uniref:Periplasmic binding protein n=1 Tax=Clostridium cellulovorans (strain ATCC 35296 / DSM 3052 / OCM 3 / 743B) TaxID=573061 RepID=D9SL07_CLOC7|nr:ABC transporter substrate-binding protein [Clostridium cellulovorans]ADL53579.1 periplasmic binding protein [Clostridium cellulovorans 743B]
MLKKKVLSLCVVLALTGILAGCNGGNKADNTNSKETVSASSGVSYPYDFKDDHDREITIKEEPKKVISLSPAITETIYALGEEDRLVGRSDSDDYPIEVTKIDSLGTVSEPNVEKIVSLNPDIVVVSSITKDEVVEKIQKLGINVVVIKEATSLEGVYDKISTVAALFNDKGDGEDLVEDMKEKVEDITEKVKDLDKPSVYYVVGYGEYGDYAATGDTFIGNIIERAGATNAASDGTNWSYSLEKLVQKNPDILVCTNKYDTKAGIKAANGYKELSAVKGEKLYEIDEDLLNRQGPRVVDGLEELAKIIHPEVFNKGVKVKVS